MWNLPNGAVFVGEDAHRHPNDDSGSGYYRLIRFTATGKYSLLGMAGEVRSCPQRWASEIESDSVIEADTEAGTYWGAD